MNAAPTTAGPVVETGRRRTIIVVGIMMAALLQTLDSTIVNVALPTIEGNLGASIDEGTWIVTGYIISNVIAIPLAPFLLARIGRRQYYAMSIIGFTAASVLCGTATSLPMLVVFRIVQGAFGGGLIATSQIVLRDTFPPDKLGSSSALFAIALTVGPAVGPVFGGILTDQFSWPWVFEINLIPGAIASVIMLTMLRNPVAPRRVPFDAGGIALLALGLGSLQYVLDEGNRNDWFGDPRIVTFALLSIAGLAAFVAWELWGTTHPIVNLRVFRFRNVAFGFVAAILLGMVNFGPTVMMPQYVQSILGFTATLSGWLMLSRAAPVVLLTPFVARAASRVDTRLLIAAGCGLSAVSFALIGLHMTTGSDASSFTAYLAFSGIGQALVFVPLLVAVLSTVPGAEAATASSFISLAFNLGASIASTMLVTVYDRRTFFHADVYRSVANAANPAFAHGISTQALVALARLIGREANNAGFADAIYTLVPIAAVATLCVAFMRRAGRTPAAPVIVAD
jgi:DHA2 family multidrug resistance protein